MVANAFQDWLKAGENYQDGLLVLERFSTNQVLLRLLRTGATAYNRRRLREELERLITSPPAAIHTNPHVDQLADINVPQLAPEVHTNPQLQELTTRRLQYFKEAQHLHAQLRLLPTQETRFEAARRIKQLMRENQVLWRDEEYLKKHGALPAHVDESLLPENPATMVQRVKTLATYISSKRGSAEKQALWSAEKHALERRLASE